MASNFPFCDVLYLIDAICESSAISSSKSTPLVPSSPSSARAPTQYQIAHITSIPELSLRNASPEPQNGDTCQQVEQSASQAAQQASQQASQSVQQASQQFVQLAAQASRSASQGIQQAQQSASQSIANAQRCASSADSSASSAIASAQSSAASAITRASGEMSSAQKNAASAQSDASRAVLQAGAAVAAATGSAAAAGSSSLAAAAKATQGAQSSVSAFGAAASSQLAQASQQVTASQTQAVTATQAAIAIIGSIIASTLTTALIYFLIIRHKNLARWQAQNQALQSPSSSYSSDKKFVVPDQSVTIAASQSSYIPVAVPSTVTSSSMFSKKFTGNDVTMPSTSNIKTSTIPWNPTNPPQLPSLGSWLMVQDGVSPFGPINLPTGVNVRSPLGGQLRYPHRLVHAESRAPVTLKLPLRSPTIPVIIEKKHTVAVVDIPPQRMPKARNPFKPPSNPEPISEFSNYRESRASAWTDEAPDSGSSTGLPSPPQAPKGPASVTRGYLMQIPSPKNRRSTAEWLAERAAARESLNSAIVEDPAFRSGLPKNSRGSREAQTNGRSADGYGNSGESALSKVGSNRSESATPVVGKAL